MKYLLSRVSTSLYLNMFGYDDDELNAQCMRCAKDGSVTAVITLDKSQAGGVHEKTILASDVAQDPEAFNAHFAVGQSATSQISHTKGGVLDGKVGFEGSTNWSASGEGTFVVTGHAGGPGYKAQNNTLAVFTDPDTIARFTAELIAEHLVAVSQGGRLGVKKKAAPARSPLPGRSPPPPQRRSPHREEGQRDEGHNREEAPPRGHACNLGDPGELAGFLLWRRYRAGGAPNARLKARLNAASDS